MTKDEPGGPMLCERYAVADVDSHIIEPADLWTSRVDPKWGDLVPHVKFHERDDFDAALDRVRGADDDPELSGRVTLSAVCHPDDPGAYAPNMIQAFVRTDVVAAGLLAFGQHVELQWHLPAA